MIKCTFLIILLITSFIEIVKAEKLVRPGLLLTFDDRNMLNWEKQIPLFAKYNAHVTFFVDHFDELTPAQISALQKLRSASHSIGCHGLRHLKAAEYCEKYPVERYISEEIMPAIKIMEEDGFTPTCFAYPNSNHNDITDRTLLNYFRHLRSGCHIAGSMESKDCAFVKTENIQNKRCINGISFHPKSRNDELVIQAKKAIDRIAKNMECLILYSHDIRNIGEEGPLNFITVDALDEILEYASNKHIKFYSFDELP
jgi:peptidoglycan-N-acetylglucosamine deacetylase